MRITVHIPDKLGPRLRQTAETEGISLSALTAKALEEYLQHERKRSAGNRLLELIRPCSVCPDALEDLEKGRADDRA